MSYTITTRLLPPHSKRRSGILIPKVIFLVAHDTGNQGSTAAQNVSFYSRTAGEESASAHFFVDDVEILECIPVLSGPPEKAWHVRYDQAEDNKIFGEDANDGAIGIELCYGPKIDATEAYLRYVWLFSQLCTKFNLDPYHHITGHFLLDPARRTDPINALSKSGRSFDGLLNDVATAMGIAAPQLTQTILTPPQAQITETTLRIRNMPNTKGLILRTLPKGTSLKANISCIGEKVGTTSTWYGDGAGAWWWGGGV